MNVKQLLSILFVAMLAVNGYAQGGLTCATAQALPGAGTYTCQGMSSGTGASHVNATNANWFTFTPTTSQLMSVNSCGGGVDSRVWIMSGSCGSFTALGNNDDYPGCFSVGTTPYGSRVDNIYVQAGTTYYIEWDDRWSQSGFSWTLSLASLPPYDALLQTVSHQYTSIPANQVTSIPLTGTVFNNGNNPLTGLILTATVTNVNTGAVVLTTSSTPTTLNPGVTTTLNAGSWLPSTTPDNYTVNYTVSSAQTLAHPNNCTVTYPCAVTFNIYGRDNGTYTNGLGTSNGGIRQGSQFHCYSNNTITSVDAYIGTSNNAQNFVLEIYQIVAGAPGATPLYTSTQYTTTGSPGFVNIPLTTPLNITAGNDYLCVISHTNSLGAVNIALGYSTTVYNPGACWLKLSTGNWDHPESYNFRIAYMIRPHIGPAPANDMQLNAPGKLNEYSAIPVRQLNGQSFALNSVVKNLGTSTATNITLTANIYKDGASTPIYTNTSTALGTLATGATATLNAGTYSPTLAGNYTVTYSVSAAGTDQIPNNNTASDYFIVAQDYMARNKIINGSMGIGDNSIYGVYDNAILGQTFTLNRADFLDSVRFTLNNPAIGVPVRIDIYNTTAAGVPNAKIGQTTSYTTTQADSLHGITLTLPISTGTLNLAAGTYYLGIIEQEGYISVATSSREFTTGKTFIRWDDNPNGANVWSHNEDFSVNVVYVIDPVFKRCVTLSASATSTPQSCTVGGTATAVGTGGTGVFSYVWSNGASTVTANNLNAGSYTVTATDGVGCSTTASVTVVSNITTPSLTVTTTGASCGASNGTATVSNPNAGYTYSWSTGATGTSVNGLAAGAYSITATETSSGCTAVSSVNIASAGGPSATSTVANVNCNGQTNGSVTLTVSGGTAPYTYHWSNNATTQNLSNVAAGTYTCTVNDVNNCPFVVTGSVTEPAVLTLSALPTINNATCHGSCDGSVSGVNIVGGTTPYTYHWSNNATTANLSGLCAGNYTGTVTDSHGCTYTPPIPLTITEPAAVTPGTPTIVSTSCFGTCDGAINNMTATGGTGALTFRWSNGSTATSLATLCSGNYNVTITDANSCTASSTIVVTEPTAINITGTTTQTSGTNGTVNITVTGGTSPYTYHWSNNRNTQNLIILPAGTYTVTVTDAHSCTSTASFTVSGVGVTTINSLTRFDLMPNPTTGILNCYLEYDQNETTTVELYNATGQLLQTQVLEDRKFAQITLDLSTYAAGMYFVRLTVDGNTVVKPAILSK